MDKHSYKVYKHMYQYKILETIVTQKVNFITGLYQNQKLIKQKL